RRTESTSAVSMCCIQRSRSALALGQRLCKPQRDAEQVAGFAVKARECGLRPAVDPNGHLAWACQTRLQEPQGGALARTRGALMRAKPLPPCCCSSRQPNVMSGVVQSASTGIWAENGLTLKPYGASSLRHFAVLSR